MTRVLSFQLHLREPLLAGGLEGDPNASVGLDYIPGGMIRGALIGRWAAGAQAAPEASDTDFRRLFLDGTTRFLNGYATIPGDTVRTLPCPRSLMRRKTAPDTEGVFDFVADDQSADTTSVWQSIAGPHPFVRLLPVEEGGWRLHSIAPSRSIQVHTQRNRRKGRPIGPADGAVYRYEALAPQQVFSAAILCNDDDLSALEKHLSENICLGGSRTAGYGHTSVTGFQDDDIESWQEAVRTSHHVWGTETGPMERRNLTITCLSDLVLRNPATGQYSSSPASALAAICDRLGIELPKETRFFCRATVVGGFNRKWGLPLPQTAALAMGSVFVLRDVSPSREKLRLLLRNGIGERTIEGFGRLAVDWHGTTVQYTTHQPHSQASQTEAVAVNQEDQNSLAMTTRRIVRGRISAKVIETCNNTSIAGHSISRSQLHRLRLAIKNDLIENRPWARSRIKKLIKGIKKKNKVKAKYDAMQIEGEPLLEWIESRLQSPNQSAVTILDPQLTAIGDNEIITDADKWLYHMRVVDAVLGRAAKESKREE